ncbi:nucleotide exchange factor GrpE [Aquabacter spiritensis]|uniref:Protein GrpE n=1 Tax=Aquabacter spiritensis TaxID=933073 RepID=A0A4R3LUN3_9HYPH|nr:nucleotide exchange factor GrpE [Aquabacter spiritensis]TCT04310.1 molecular chaperone GrpE [Aquabacter spiritensis]
MSEKGGTPEAHGSNPAVDPEIAEMEELGAAETFRAERERLEGEIAAFKDKFLRAFAEAENIRRRAEKEIADAKTYGIAAFARDVLNVADDLSRALGTVDTQAAETAEGGFKSLLDGLELTERGLHKALEKHGIRKIDPMGGRFDPNLHQAMFEVPDESVPAGTVVQVVQSGYVIGDRVLRPAMVGVSRGGPKAAPAKAGSDSGQQV